MSQPHAILIAGPTASGKSQRALDLAAAHGGVVINADSMQVYRELRVLSARPSAEEEASVPHRLYGHVGAATRYSVGQWLADATAVLAEVRAAGRVPVFVGGTGLYFKALTEGLATIPPVPPEVRADVVAAAEGVPAEGAPRPARRPRPRDGGGDAAERPRPDPPRPRGDRRDRPAAGGLASGPGKPAAGRCRTGRTPRPRSAAPPPPCAHRRAGRTHGRGGRTGEARAVGALGLSREMPAMKAIGVRQFLGHDAGDLSLDEAIASLKTETPALRQAAGHLVPPPDARLAARVAGGCPPHFAVDRDDGRDYFPTQHSETWRNGHPYVYRT
jgi:tRNA dimethylallyltransferase